MNGVGVHDKTPSAKDRELKFSNTMHMSRSTVYIHHFLQYRSTKKMTQTHFITQFKTYLNKWMFLSPL